MEERYSYNKWSKKWIFKYKIILLYDRKNKINQQMIEMHSYKHGVLYQKKINLP